MDSVHRSYNSFKNVMEKHRQGRKMPPKLADIGHWRKWSTPRSNSSMSGVINYKRAKHKSTNLETQIARQIWPTPDSGVRDGFNQSASPNASKRPTLARAVKIWPTPRSAKGMAMKCTQGMANLKHKCYLETEVAYQEHGSGGYLNPTWVEWLMGMPIGWSSLKPLSKDLLSNWQNNKKWWDIEPNIPRLIDKEKYRVQRLKALGNAQVPLQVKTVWKLLNKPKEF